VAEDNSVGMKEGWLEAANHSLKPAEKRLGRTEDFRRR
jgi:hypothetical protein